MKKTREYCPVLARAMGSRIEIIRKVKMGHDDPNETASILFTTKDEWLAIEAGTAKLDAQALFQFCLKFAVSPNFILYGDERAVEPELLELVDFTQPEGKPGANPFYHTYYLKSEVAKPTAH